MNNGQLEQYKKSILKQNYEYLSNEKITLGRLISDTAKRIQDLSGRDPALLEEQIKILKELKAKLSLVIKIMQKKRDEL